MVIAVVLRAGGPAGKARALLEGGIAMTEQVRLRHTHLFQGAAQGGPSPLTHADDRNIGRFNQGDGEIALLNAALVARRNHPGGQPAGRAAADNDDILDRPNHYRVRSPCGPDFSADRSKKERAARGTALSLYVPSLSI